MTQGTACLILEVEIEFLISLSIIKENPDLKALGEVKGNELFSSFWHIMNTLTYESYQCHYWYDSLSHHGLCT